MISRHNGKGLLLRIIKAHLVGQTAQEFAEQEIQRMTACEICGGTGKIGDLDCPACTGTAEDQHDNPDRSV